RGGRPWGGSGSPAAAVDRRGRGEDRSCARAPADTRYTKLMHTPAHGRAGGKVILLGGHAVVYGRPALASGVPIGVDAPAGVGDGRRVLSEVPAPKRGDDRGDRLVAEAAELVGLAPARVVVRVRSAIPAGRGLGSSAALSVAVLRAMAAAAGRSLD